jgi:hypothetical protein
LSAGCEQRLRRSRMYRVESLLATFTKDADCVDDDIDAAEPGQPGGNIHIAGEIGCQRIHFGRGPPAGGDHAMPGRAQSADQPSADETGRTGHQNDHLNDSCIVWNRMKSCEVEPTMLTNVPTDRQRLRRSGKIFRKPDVATVKRVARDALVSGSAASLTSAAALMACSAKDEGSVFGALNGPSQWLWGEEEAYTREATLRHTATGYVIHHATSVFWGVLHESVFGGSRRRKSPLQHCAEAALSASTAYVVDYHLTPRRFRPGFEKHVDGKGMVAVYAAFAAGLALTAIIRNRGR